MRVGILTSHYAMNPGAILQTYGLQKTIGQLGHSAEIIDFRHRPNFRLVLFLKSLIRSSLLALRGSRPDNLKSAAQDAYARFGDRWIRKTEPVRSFEELASAAERFDAIVVGSDQVWNADLWSKVPLTYFLTFCNGSTLRRVSYAPCFGQKDQPIWYLRQLDELVKNFDYLSVRGRFNWEILRNYTTADPEIVVDPTLLCSFEDIRAPVNSYKRYVLVYSQSRRLAGEFRKVAETLKKKSLSVVSLSSNVVYPFADYYTAGAGPSEFVRLVSDAEFVLTTSFHGTIFSLKYRKPFVAFCKGERSIRITDLLDMCGTTDRAVASADEAWARGLLDAEIDYGAVGRRLDKHVARSMAFLRKALG